MRHPPRAVAGALLTAAVIASIVTPSTPASAAPTTGTVRVTVVAPQGVPGTVTLVGKTRWVAAKPAAGTSAVTALSLPAGGYLVPPPSTTVDGVRYVGRPSSLAVAAIPGKTTNLTVTYAPDGGARRLRASAVTGSTVSLAWEAPAGAGFALRRTNGTTPVTVRTLGVGVPTKGTTAVDKGLKPGAQYTYSLFTWVKGHWSGPLTIVVSTAPPPGSTQATYVAAPSTLLAKPTDIASATTTGSGVQVVLQSQVATPLLGSAVVLPVSAALPGGFLGVVTTISPDGRTLSLTAGALIDAFDYYELDIKDFATAPEAAAGANASGKAKAEAVTASCGGSATEKVTFDPTVALGGHFNTKVDKYRFLGVDIPTGASLDMELRVTLTGAADVKVTGQFECKISFLKQFKMLSVSPVPIALSYTSSAKVTVGGALEVTNLGFKATGGVRINGSMNLKNGASFSGNRITEIEPLAPAVKANGQLGVKVGGEVIAGPGVGTENAAVIAGISGELYPLDATLSPHFPAGDPRYNQCAKVEAKLTAGLSLTAKAWLSSWSFSAKVTLDALDGSVSYPGSPWFFPVGCKNLPAEESKDSLLGDGVTKIDDSTVGGADQWGHLEGFAPGKKTWVLSTGHIADAVGAPESFASTDLGREGDPELSTLAGFPTWDAAAYTVTLKPTGSTLHVRYVFASEEYPEYVGSSYNDVMVVRVNGKNCATVPGGTDPVSVNTINDKTNSAYYVDNSAGAAGYSTTMDGLTVPLTCSVPVTPGEPVTVQIAVADTSDHIYDSAVALLDGGIWTD